MKQPPKAWENIKSQITFSIINRFKKLESQTNIKTRVPRENKNKKWKSYSNSFNTICRNSEKPKDNN